MMVKKAINRCPVCKSRLLKRCAEIYDVPVFCNILLDSRPYALEALKGDLTLELCTECGHVHNSAFKPELMNYTEDYDCSLHYSSSFNSFANELASNLVEEYSLYDKTIVEIGCGKGDFISLLCTLGGSKGFGFDPSFGEHIGERRKTGNVEVTRDYFSEKFSFLDPDFVCCRHALEHIEEPIEFLISIRRSMTKDNQTYLYFEVPSSLYTFKELGIWDLIYEHCGYFCESSLHTAFIASGFAVTKLDSCFGDQYLSLEAKLPSENDQNDKTNNIGSLSHGLDHLLSLAGSFREFYEVKLKDWNKRLSDYKRDDLKVVVWGGGSKGVTFLNVLNVDDEVSYIVDINPNKNGKYTAGTGHKVVSPEFLKSYQPNIVIVMNPLYVGEITNELSKLKVKSEVITA